MISDERLRYIEEHRGEREISNHEFLMLGAQFEVERARLYLKQHGLKVQWEHRPQVDPPYIRLILADGEEIEIATMCLTTNKRFQEYPIGTTDSTKMTVEDHVADFESLIFALSASPAGESFPANQRIPVFYANRRWEPVIDALAQKYDVERMDL